MGRTTALVDPATFWWAKLSATSDLSVTPSTVVETVAPLLIRQHSLDPTGPWLLSAGGVEGPTAADFVLAKPLGNARAMGWLADFPALEAWLDRVKKLPSYEKAYS